MWARVDDGWWCHPKVMGLNMGARGLWISALSWSCAQRTNEVPQSFLAMVQADQGHADDLVDAGLWIDNGDGWTIHDWEEYQDLSTSEQRSIAGRKGGLKSGETRRVKRSKNEAKTSPDLQERRSKTKQTGFASEANDEAGTRPDPSRPVTKHIPALDNLGVSVADSPHSAERFDEFWQLWIDAKRNRDKPAAKTAWRNATKKVDPQLIINAAKLYTTSGIEPKFMKYPHRWLKAESWNDSPPEPKRAAGEKPGFLGDEHRDGETRVLTKAEFLEGW